MSTAKKQKPRRFVRMFQPRFADLVRSGAKAQTIRRRPKRMPEPGDIIDCRQWAGRPYGSPHVKLCEGVIMEVTAIWIWEESVQLNDFVLYRDQDDESKRVMDIFAGDDGFDDWAGLVRWFQETHKLPFSGILIDWKQEPSTQLPT